MSYNNGPKIVIDGLVLCLDAGNAKSYPAGGTVFTDLSGNGNNATLIAGPTYSSLNGGGVVLDATDDFISIVPSASLKVDGGNFTIFSVHKIGTAFDFYGQFFYQSGDGSGNATNKSIFFQRLGANQINLDFYGNGTSCDFGANSFAANTLVFIAVSFNKAALTSIYFRNGIFSTVQSHAGSPSFTALSSVQIGKRYNTTAGFSTKDLDGINHITMLYNKALTNIEILQNYNALRGRFGL